MEGTVPARWRGLWPGKLAKVEDWLLSAFLSHILQLGLQEE